MSGVGIIQCICKYVCGWKWCGFCFNIYICIYAWTLNKVKNWNCCCCCETTFKYAIQRLYAYHKINRPTNTDCRQRNLRLYNRRSYIILRGGCFTINNKGLAISFYNFWEWVTINNMLLKKKLLTRIKYKYRIKGIYRCCIQ